MPTMNAWELWWSTFKDGEEVVVIDEDDKIHWGRLKTTDEGVTLRRPYQADDVIPFERIRLAAHDGFPVRRLMGADGDPSIESWRSAEGQIRHELSEEIKPLTAARIGDPYDIEGVQARLLNPGNAGDYYWDNDAEEVLQMWAGDGAKGLLWDLSTVFMVEVAER